MSKKKNLFSRVFNRALHLLARISPGAQTVRPFLHRLRGVKIGKWVWIGDDVYLENEYPERVELQDGAVLSIRAMIIAHTRGAGNVVIGPWACVGPGAMVVCSAGKTLRIGEGAVISSGAIVTSSVPARMIIAPPRSVPVGLAGIPFGLAKSVQEFIAGMHPLPRSKPRGTQEGIPASEKNPKRDPSAADVGE